MKFFIGLILAASCVSAMAPELAPRRALSFHDATEVLMRNHDAVDTTIDTDRNVMNSVDADRNVLDSVDLDPQETRKLRLTLERALRREEGEGSAAATTPRRRGDSALLRREADKCKEQLCEKSGGKGEPDHSKCTAMADPKCSRCHEAVVLWNKVFYCEK